MLCSMLRSGLVSGGLLDAVCHEESHTDFWNCSRNSCAWPFCVRSTLDCIVWRAASTGAKAWVPLAAMVGCDFGRRPVGKESDGGVR
jgi:hypothetical protein